MLYALPWTSKIATKTVIVFKKYEPMSYPSPVSPNAEAPSVQTITDWSGFGGLTGSNRNVSSDGKLRLAIFGGTVLHVQFRIT